VKKCTHKKTGVSYALKIIDKAAVGDKVAMLEAEVDIMRRCQHVNIIELVEMFETPQKLYLVLELVTGGELFDRIVTRGTYSEADASSLVTEILSAISYIHAQNITHRDLKPENLLYSSDQPDAVIKLADFGLSKLIPENTLLKTACGTPGYVAPEVLKCEGYGKAADLWSVGVIMYILLCGFPPFYDDNTAKLFALIMNVEYSFPTPYWDNISPEAKDLIQRLLVFPEKRLTAAQALAHPWIANRESNSKQDISGALAELRKFNATRRLKMAILTTIAMNRFAGAVTRAGSAYDEDSESVSSSSGVPAS